MTKRKIYTFAGTCFLLLGGSFMGQGQRTANPYANLLLSNLFAKDALAWECGSCHGGISCYNIGAEYMECEMVDDQCNDQVNYECSY